MNKECIICGKEVSDKRAKYCSEACKQKNKRLKGELNPTPEVVEQTKSKARKIMEELNVELEAKGLAPLVMGSDIPPVEFVSSGIKEIDAITGGLPRRKVTEIFGLKGVGKTFLMKNIVSSLPELSILYIDAEGGLPTPPDNVTVSNEHILERVQSTVESALQKNKHDMIVIDSIASLVPRVEEEGEEGEAHMGLKARLMSQWMRRINTNLFKSNTAVVFINQQRESMNPYGPNKFTPGGHAVPYAASLRLELKSNKVDKFEGGHWVHVEVEKSRVCKPYQKTKFKLMYDERM